MEGLKQEARPGPGQGLRYLLAAAVIWAAVLATLAEPRTPQAAQTCFNSRASLQTRSAR